MKLGLFTAVFNELGFDDLLLQIKRYPQIDMLEIGTGGWPGASHLDLDGLLESTGSVTEFRNRLSDAGYAISALSCHANPVHPDKAVAQQADSLFRRTVQLAERLGVSTVVTFSGCPGGSVADRTPNWITTAWPPEYADALDWQWETQLIPYWQRSAAIASDAGVRVALEAHPGFMVYNPETLLRLRAAAGPAIGINLDPSHLWWQGIDIPMAIEALANSIFHVHAKDVATNSVKAACNGVLDTMSYRRMAERSWIFRTVGWGHSALEWKAIASALRLVGYDYVLSIEHEDALASIREGLTSAITILSSVLLREPAVDAWWA